MEPESGLKYLCIGARLELLVEKEELVESDRNFDVVIDRSQRLRESLFSVPFDTTVVSRHRSFDPDIVDKSRCNQCFPRAFPVSVKQLYEVLIQARKPPVRTVWSSIFSRWQRFHTARAFYLSQDYFSLFLGSIRWFHTVDKVKEIEQAITSDLSSQMIKERSQSSSFHASSGGSRKFICAMCTIPTLSHGTSCNPPPPLINEWIYHVPQN